MTAVRSLNLKCDEARPGCRGTYLAEPTDKVTSVKALRVVAGRKGWQVMNGNHGRDVCPPCRIATIEQQAEIPGLAVEDPTRVTLVTHDVGHTR